MYWEGGTPQTPSGQKILCLQLFQTLPYILLHLAVHLYPLQYPLFKLANVTKAKINKKERNVQKENNNKNTINMKKSSESYNELSLGQD